MTVSLELVKQDYNLSAEQPVWPQLPPGRVLPYGGGEDAYYTYPSREATQAVFAGGSWLLVTRATQAETDLIVLSADYSRARSVTGLPAQRGPECSITLLPDSTGRKTVVVTSYTTDRVTGRGRTDVALLDVPQAHLEVLQRIATGHLVAVWGGEQIVAAYRSSDGANVMVLIDPATHAAREFYRERPEKAGADVLKLWSSPHAGRIAFDRMTRRVHYGPSQLARRDVVVVDVATGRGGPVAYDPRGAYYHGVVKWESEDSLVFYVYERQDRATIYRAKLRPVGATSP